MLHVKDFIAMLNNVATSRAEFFTYREMNLKKLRDGVLEVLNRNDVFDDLAPLMSELLLLSVSFALVRFGCLVRFGSPGVWCGVLYAALKLQDCPVSQDSLACASSALEGD